MKSVWLLIGLSAVALGAAAWPGCGEPAQQAATSAAPNAQPRDSDYPYSEVDKVYDTELEATPRRYFKDYPDLDKQHTAALRAFIAKEYPREKFIKEMVRDKDMAVFNRATADIQYRKTKEFEDSFAVVTSVSVNMAAMSISGLCDVYAAKFVEKDPLKIELLDMATTDEQRQYAVRAQREATAKDFRDAAGAERETRPGDRFFRFSSPAATWENCCGREGFLQVRDKKITEAIITMMN